MKKSLIVFLLVNSFVLTAFSQNKDFSRWSIMGEFGFNYLDGDINQNATRILPSSTGDMAFGATLEYSFTPLWGIAFDFTSLSLNATNKSPAVFIDTQVYNAGMRLTVNLTKFIFPQSKSRFFINGGLGMGIARYTYGVTPVSYQFANNYGFAGSIPTTLSVEYNFSKLFSFGLKGQYIAYTKDNLEGVPSMNWSGVTNDYVAEGTLFLRYKINALKNAHVRNMNMDVYNPDLALFTANVNTQKITNLDSTLDNLESRFVEQRKQMDSMAAILSRKVPDTEFVVVPITVIEDKQLNSSEPIGAVYFDYDQSELVDAELVGISKVASKMNADTSLMVEVRGYCDHLGTIPYNFRLSQRRSDRVKAYLVKIWGIPSDHIISNGKGKISLPPSRSRLNRRCDFYFTDSDLSIDSKSL